MSSIPSTPISPSYQETYEKLPSIESGTFDAEVMEKGECLEVEELDQAGNVVATYVASDGVGYVKRDGGGGRIDVVVSFCLLLVVVSYLVARLFILIYGCRGFGFDGRKVANVGWVVAEEDEYLGEGGVVCFFAGGISA